MSQILTVFGATGQQGSAVIDYVLNDTELSQKFKLRAVTRDPNSQRSKQLKAKDIQVVQGDILDRNSLDEALKDTHTVFLITVPHYGVDALKAEFESAKNVADVSLEKGVQYIIFSTLPSISNISGGKYTRATMFDAKAQAEKYIRTLPINSAFYSPGSFMENYLTVAAPKRASDGTNAYVIAMHISPKTRFPLVDAGADTGKFIGSILAKPDAYNGKVIYAAERLYSLEEIAMAMSKSTGEEVVYRQISVESYKAMVPFGGDILAQTMSYIEEFGYYGTDTEKLIEEAAQNARGRLTMFEEFLENHPLKLS